MRDKQCMHTYEFIKNKTIECLLSWKKIFVVQRSLGGSRNAKIYSLYARSRNFNQRNVRTLPGSSREDWLLCDITVECCT
ncbi:hypothetical protein HanIR_Chr16g0819881 [Helianthus annuus]|nr:hypothetical protein HanIR_Chr16g0819881 [Helianthus annuus]